MTLPVDLPVDHVNAELRKLKRPISEADDYELAWQGDELGISILWPEGGVDWVSLGPIITDLVNAQKAVKH